MLFFFRSMVFFWILLDMLAAEREPTPCYHDAYSVGAPRWAFWEKGWQIHCETTVSRCLSVFFWLTKGLYSFWCGLVIWMLHIGRARHPGPGKRFFTPGQLSVEFVNVGGWLTYMEF